MYDSVSLCDSKNSLITISTHSSRSWVFSPGVSPSSLAAGSSRLLTDEVISSNKGLILMSPMFCELWVLVVKLWSTDYSRGGLSLVFAVLSHNLAIEQMHGPVGVTGKPGIMRNHTNGGSPLM